MPHSLVIRIIVVGALLIGGVLSGFYAGHRLETNAREVWETKASQEAERITDTYLFWLTTYQVQLRGAAALFHASTAVDEDELLNALDLIEGLEAAIPLETVAFARPSDQGWVVDVSTDLDGPVASEARIDVLQMVAALEGALELPDRVVMGIPFDAEGRQKSLLAIAAPNAGRRGAVVSMVDMTSLLTGLEELHVPAGLQMTLTVEHDTPQGREVETVWAPQTQAVPDFQITYATDSGQVHWHFVWDVLPEYRGGPDNELARVVELGTLLVVALVGVVIGLLFRQNLRVHREVEQRTAQLNASVLEAQAANRSKSVFLANVSHEIRTPLNAIMGFADVLERQLKDPGQRQHVKVMQESAKQLLQIISGILDLSRLEAGQLSLHPEPTDALSIFTDLGQVYRQRARDQQTDLQIDIQPTVPPVLIIDGARLREVLAPLVDNALKFTRAGTVRVEASATAVSGTINLSIRVIDTGIGIPVDQQDRIFELFRQKDGQSINDYGGTGLGLTIARQLVMLMEGDITVQSEEGKGSTFSIEIPHVPVGAHDLIDDLSRSAGPAETTTDGPIATSAAVPIAVPVAVRALLAAQVNRWRNLQETQTINEVEDFAHDLIAIGQEHEFAPLHGLGERLLAQASGFDLSGMEETLASFGDLVATPRPSGEGTVH